MLGQLSRAGIKGDAFLTGVQLIAHGCQRAFELSDLPGLLPALTKVRKENAKKRLRLLASI